MKKLFCVALLLLLSFEANAAVVYIQPPGSGGSLLQSSGLAPDGSNFDRTVWDNFTLPSTQNITEILWRGGYDPARFGSGGPVVDFNVSIYPSIPAGTQPDIINGSLVDYTVGGNAGETLAGIFGGTTMYDYRFILPAPFQVVAGTKYWVMIYAPQQGIPDWGLAVGLGGDGNHFRRQHGQGDVYLIVPGDAAFTLKTAGPELPLVSVTATDNTATEAGLTAGTFTVTRTLMAGALTVNYTVSGNAIPVSDYNVLSGSVTFQDGSATATITVTPVDDTLVEGDETVIMTLTADLAYTISAPNSATVTIQDDDVGNLPVVSVTAQGNLATEAGATPGTFRISRSGNSGASLSVHFTLSGTATNGTDYNTITSPVTLPAGSSSLNIIVTPIDDTAYEGDETAILTLSAHASYEIKPPPDDSATVTLQDDDPPPLPVVIVTATDITATEAGPTTGTLRISRTGDTAASLSVFFTMSGTATNGADYTTITSPVTIPAGSSFVDITLTPVNDTTVEGDEAAILTLSANAAYDISAPPNNSISVTIQDDDMPPLPVVSVAATDNLATEAGLTTGTFTISRTLTTGALTVNYTVNGSATPVSDYNALSGSVTIPDGSGSATITVTPVDDTLMESDETVIITLSPDLAYTVGAPSSATVTIQDNDNPVQSFPFVDDFSTDKGWVGYETGKWERASALAGGGENGNPDPGIDYSPSGDNFVLGFAAGADYPNDLREESSIISPPIDCTGQGTVLLKFRRYLNIDGLDQARIYVSSNGTTWIQVWENPAIDLTDNLWVPFTLDISAVAANQATVFIKFTIGLTDSTRRFSGWNIDDLEVTSGGIYPAEGTMGTKLTLAGYDFSGKKGKVFIGDIALKVLGQNNGVISAELKKPVVPGIYNVTIQPNGAAPIIENDAFVVKAPEIGSLDITEGAPSDQVTMLVRFFGTKKGKVYLGSVANGQKKSCRILGRTTDPLTGVDEIVFSVPNLPAGTYDLIITNGVGTGELTAGFRIR